MGMAASQARYLGLTARKTNVEYEGQQINQARTALANQSAELFNQMLNMTVPTAPSTTDFTKMSYSYSDGTNSYSIKSMTPLKDDPNYNYALTLQYTIEETTAINKKNTNPQVSLDGGNYKVGSSPATKLEAYGSLRPEEQAQIDLMIEQLQVSEPDSKMTKNLVAYKAGTEEATQGLYSFSKLGTVYYACMEDLEASREKPLAEQIPLSQYYTAMQKKEVTEEHKALLDDVSGSGRYQSITLEETPNNPFILNTETVTDEKAYNDAMQQYYYKLNVYEKTLSDINAKTEIIQKEDRTLELRLTQLDAEQKALSTEMDAVKGVRDKNIEKTFKTFS